MINLSVNNLKNAVETAVIAYKREMLERADSDEIILIGYILDTSLMACIVDTIIDSNNRFEGEK
jgi:hypothetical protein